MSSENTPHPGEAQQAAMLDELCQQETPVSVYLVNGIRLNGRIVSVDRFSILLRDATDQLIYKQAISTVIPNSNHSKPEQTRSPRTHRTGTRDTHDAQRPPRRY